jgi:hypothetical protein
LPDATPTDVAGRVRAAQHAVEQLTTQVSTASDAAVAAGVAAKDARLPSWGAVKAVLSGHYRASREQADAEAERTEEQLGALRRRLTDARRDLERATAASAAADARAAQERATRRAAAADRIRAAQGPEAARLHQLEADLAAAEDESREIDQAARAVEASQSAAGQALDRLNSAASWGTYDTWFGGGIVSSSIKHGRIDDAARAMGAVRASLDVARRELADVALNIAAPDLARVGANRTLDIWFDNFFSDLGTQSRISDGRASVVALVTALRQAQERVAARSREHQRRTADLSAERDSLLDAVV